MFADMRPDWLTLQRWAAVFAIAIFVLSATPHDHDHDDGEECVNGTCVPCHVQGLPIIETNDRFGAHDFPDAPIQRISAAYSHAHPLDAATRGHDSRAPPA